MIENSKQRAHLRAIANTLEPIFQIGKSAVTPELVTAVTDAINAREIVKLSVLSNCMEDPATIAETIAQRTRSEIVHVMGRKIVLYKQAKDPQKRKIELPK
ncbi:MAG: hypothetical protein K0R15_583 [Clostridiales bacterium]|jgi:RNA-binding protein|nr:hypothetical protein [Clostridiales bacterium]